MCSFTDLPQLPHGHLRRPNWSIDPFCTQTHFHESLKWAQYFCGFSLDFSSISLDFYEGFLHLLSIFSCQLHNHTVEWDVKLCAQADHPHPFQHPAVQLLGVTVFFLPTDTVWLLRYELPGLQCINELSPSLFCAPFFLGTARTLSLMILIIYFR